MRVRVTFTFIIVYFGSLLREELDKMQTRIQIELIEF